MGILLLGCLITIPFAAWQWPPLRVLDAAAGIASFAEATTGLLLLAQAQLLRQRAGTVLGLGYLVGGWVVFVTIIAAPGVATTLWLFRLWHGVFVVSVLTYAVLNAKDASRARHMGCIRAKPAIAGGLLFIAALILYLIFLPFSLPTIIHGSDYITLPNLLINSIQFVIVALAWWILFTAPRKTVLSVWMEVVACAVAIDIVLFVLGARLFSVGLYISKLNNLIAATTLFGVIFYRYIRIQAELHRHRVLLVRANRKLARMALRDTLTGLPNRAALDQYLDLVLARAVRTEAHLAICIIDLDDFKQINDQHGHEMGDCLLRAFSKRITGILRKGEYFARLGGDEFVLVLESLSRMDDLVTVLKRMIRASSEPFDLPDAPTFSINASIGVAFYPRFTSRAELLRAADQALYCAKGSKNDREQNWIVHGTADPFARGTHQMSDRDPKTHSPLRHPS